MTALPQSPAQSSTRGVGWLMAAGVAWGTSGTLGTLLVNNSSLDFTSVAGFRNVMGGLVMLVVVVALRRFQLPRSRAGWTKVAGLAVSSALYQWAFFTAIGTVGVPLATMVAIGSAPLMVAAFDVARKRVLADRALATSLLLALVGLGLLVGTPSALAPATLVAGMLAALLAGACFAAISLLGAHYVADFEPVTGTGLAFGSGGLVVLILAALGGHPVVVQPSVATVGLLLLIGLIPSAFAYLSYLRGLATQTGTMGSLISLLEPVTAATLAWLVLNQRLSAWQLVGAIILLAAVALASRIRPARR